MKGTLCTIIAKGSLRSYINYGESFAQFERCARSYVIVPETFEPHSN